MIGWIYVSEGEETEGWGPRTERSTRNSPWVFHRGSGHMYSSSERRELRGLSGFIAMRKSVTGDRRTLNVEPLG